MSASGASESDHEVGSPPLAVVRCRGTQRFLQVAQQLLRGGLLDHVLTHWGITPVQGTQLVDPVRVFEQPDVDHPRRAVGDAVLVAEGKARDEQALSRTQLLRQLLQLRDVHPMVRAIVAAAGSSLPRTST